jgi:hypothetical protein
MESCEKRDFILKIITDIIESRLLAIEGRLETSGERLTKLAETVSGISDRLAK